jgi:hypothetical protein
VHLVSLMFLLLTVYVMSTVVTLLPHLIDYHVVTHIIRVSPVYISREQLACGLILDTAPRGRLMYRHTL